jgi:hypothetical protein
MSQVYSDTELHVIANGETISNVSKLVQVCLTPGSAVAKVTLTWAKHGGSGNDTIALQAAANGEAVQWPDNDYPVPIGGRDITATISGTGAVCTLNVIGTGKTAVAVA